MSKTFGADEKKILDYFHNGVIFSDEETEYAVVISGKPTCSKGEPKTDIYVLAKNLHGNNNREYKISYKKKNADFLENKISSDRAENLLGKNWSTIIFNSTNDIKESFLRKPLIYKTAMQHTRAGSFTLGWKFELTNKENGALSGRLAVSNEQVIDIYSGTSLPEDKRNAYVNGKIVSGSGVAEYVLLSEPRCISSPEDIISNMFLINESLSSLPPVYFACKALNYRSFEKKSDGNRPLCVYVDWSIEEDKLKSTLVFDNPLSVSGNEVLQKLSNCLLRLGIKTTADIDSHNVIDPRIIHF